MACDVDPDKFSALPGLRRGIKLVRSLAGCCGLRERNAKDPDSRRRWSGRPTRRRCAARTFRMTTEEFVKRMKTEPVRRQQTTLPHVIAIGGGVPIKVGNDVIGGVGLSGSPGVDEPCVNAGIDKVKDQLQ